MLEERFDPYCPPIMTDTILQARGVKEKLICQYAVLDPSTVYTMARACHFSPAINKFARDFWKEFIRVVTTIKDDAERFYAIEEILARQGVYLELGMPPPIDIENYEPGDVAVERLIRELKVLQAAGTIFRQIETDPDFQLIASRVVSHGD